MKKNEYTTYSGGIRYYDSEKEGKEAVKDAVRFPAAPRADGEDARKEYVNLLESFGCDRYHKNHLGVSYADIEGR